MANVFNNGDPGSKAVWSKALNTLVTNGQTQLDSILNLENTELIELNNQLVAVNSRRARTSRLLPISTVADFSVKDFLTVDQTKTTGTVRIDAGTATLKERAVPSSLLASQVIFSANAGSIQTLDTNQNQYRVTNNSVPTGQFDVTLNGSFNISVLVFDILAYASAPQVQVSLTTDGITFTDATSISLTGYRVTAWFNNAAASKIRVKITPALPDSLYGTQYSFGFSDLSARATSFDLRSLIVSMPITFNPNSQQLQLSGVSDPNIAYFLSLSTTSTPGTSIQTSVGTPVDIPGVASANQTGLTPNGTTGILSATLPSTYLQSSLQVIETTGGANTPMIVVPGLSYSDSNYTHLTREYIGVNGTSMVLVNSSRTLSTSRTFKAIYLTVQSPITAVLQVLLSTTSQATTPFFTGATLEEI